MNISWRKVGRRGLWAGLLAAAGLLGCAVQQGAVTPSCKPQCDPAKPHHRPDGFQNNYWDFNVPTGEALKWQFSRSTPPRPSPPLPVVAPDFSAPQPNTTWIGHSTVVVHMGNLRFITDPHFSERASPVSWAGPKRLTPLPVQARELPHLDVVLISHNHYDHLDLASVQALQTQAGGPPLFIVPLGLKAWFEREGISKVVELDWWDSHRVGQVEFMLTPSQHWSSRTPFDRRSTLWGGFAAFAPDFQFFYSGDTGYSKDFQDIRQRLSPRQQDGGFDVAMLPVGCYEPRPFMRNQHVNPADAVQIFKDLGARRAFGVHWGTFEDLCDEPLDQAPQDLAAARTSAGVPDADFITLQHGQTQVWPRRTPH